MHVLCLFNFSKRMTLSVQQIIFAIDIYIILHNIYIFDLYIIFLHYKMAISVRVHKHTFISFINLRRNMIIPIRLFPNHHLFDVHYSLPDPEEDPQRSHFSWGWLDHYERSCREDKEAVSFRTLSGKVCTSQIICFHLWDIFPHTLCNCPIPILPPTS